MEKILVLIRTSTDAQSIQDQHREMEEFCISEGWTKEQIIWVEEQGASAAKVDDVYRAMIDKAKAYVEADKDIKCFAVWHLNRLARTEEVWVEVKSFFVQHKVQILVKNPYLKLLTPSGEVDQGIELAMGLLAILSKQDQAERKEKFKRAKTAMAKRGQFIGGNTRKYGYKVVDGYFVEDEVEGPIVRQVFQLYSTGDYSTYSLSKELADNGIEISDNKIGKIIRCRAYYGEESSTSGMHYPPIISKELFDKVEGIREGNKIDMKRGERIVLGAKIVKCYVCGATCTSNSRHFVCSKHSHHGPCDNGFAIRQDVVNDLLWRVASAVHMSYLIEVDENKEREYRHTISVLEGKIELRKTKIANDEEKKVRLAEVYVRGLIDAEQLATRQKRIEDDIKDSQQVINLLSERIAVLNGLLDSKDNSIDENLILDEMDMVNRYEVIHKHIKSLTGKPISYGDRDPRCSRPNGVEIEVTTILGSVWKYMYFPKYYKKHNLYVWNGRRLVGDAVTSGT